MRVAPPGLALDGLAALPAFTALAGAAFAGLLALAVLAGLAGLAALPAFAAFTGLALAALFALGNSTDAFLLLRARDAGVPAAAVPLLWFLHHVVKTLAGLPGGALSDRVPRGAVVAAGWGAYALAYSVRRLWT